MTTIHLQADTNSDGLAVAYCGANEWTQPVAGDVETFREFRDKVINGLVDDEDPDNFCAVCASQS